MSDIEDFTFNALETYATNKRDLSNRITDDEEEDLDELVGNEDEVSPSQQQQVVDLPEEDSPSPSKFLSPSLQQELQLVVIPPEDSSESQFLTSPMQQQELQLVDIPPEGGDFDLQYFGAEQQAYWERKQREKEQREFVSTVSLPQSLVYGNTKMELDEGEIVRQEQQVVINPIQIDQLTQGMIAE